ncbi:MAG: 1-acyl-sn-glycerol-3-phosphate acyltransferase [Leptospiraceae bacterium]|nr:1-acyl-sn-glycerol-3-phosphate acyltransferase [Leptospiraceae bacterium]MCP5511687.1 1-acyl-sn-glycerol-3-phosphate acyltransferase [Leptospiraceae bacterium]
MSIESFIRPSFNYPFMWFIDASIHSLLLAVHNIDEVVIQPDDREMLKKLKDQRVIFVSNHPSTKEPPISYVIGNLMYSRFHYMASREVFDWGYGLVGKMIQSIGAYSVIAGTGDRESLKTTRKILAAPAGKLVLFPEGEPTGAENDNLLPFQPGVTQLGLWGFEDALKNDPNAEILILPAFIKYRFNGPIEKIREEVDRSIENMEKHIGITKHGKNIIDRLFAVGKFLIEKNEREFGITTKDDQSFDYRIGQIRHKILNYVADTVGLKKFNRDDDAINKLRYILSVFEMVTLGLPDPKNELPSLASAKWGRKYLQKAYDFISIKGSYLKEFPSAERIYEWIYRFESELFQSSKPRRAKAFVHFSEPVRLSEEYKNYKNSKNKKQIVEELTSKIRGKIQSILDEEVKRSEILFPLDKIF